MSNVDKLYDLNTNAFPHYHAQGIKAGMSFTKCPKKYVWVNIQICYIYLDSVEFSPLHLHPKLSCITDVHSLCLHFLLPCGLTLLQGGCGSASIFPQQTERVPHLLTEKQDRHRVRWRPRRSLLRLTAGSVEFKRLHTDVSFTFRPPSLSAFQISEKSNLLNIW